MRVRITASKHTKALLEMLNPLLIERQPHSNRPTPSGRYAINSLSLHELQRLTGYLQFIARITLHGHLHLRYLYAAQSWYTPSRSPTPQPSSLARRRITQHMRDEVLWWHDILLDPHWNGMSLNPPDTARNRFDLWTDVSTLRGIGGYFISQETPYTLRAQQDNNDLTPPPDTVPSNQAFFERPP